MVDQQPYVTSLDEALPATAPDRRLTVLGALRDTLRLGWRHGGMAGLLVLAFAAVSILPLVLAGLVPAETRATWGLLGHWLAMALMIPIVHAAALAAALASLAGRPVRIADASGTAAQAAVRVLPTMGLQALGVVALPLLVMVAITQVGLLPPAANGALGVSLCLVLLAMVFPALAVVLEEDQGPLDALARAMRLTRGHRWTSILIQLSALAAYLLVAFTASFLAGALLVLLGLTSEGIALGFLVKESLVTGVTVVAFGGLTAVVFKHLTTARPARTSNT